MTYKRLPVNTHEGYEVDTAGNVWSCKLRAKGGMNPQKWHKLSPNQWRKQPRVVLYADSKKTPIFISRLMALTFIPNPDKKPLVCHLNGDSSDNRVENLYWGTDQENQDDRAKHGTKCYGESNGFSKLKTIQVRVIKHALGIGVSQSLLARIFKISKANIQSIVAERTWKHVQV